MMTRVAIIALLIALVVYGFIEAWPLLSGPRITLSSPADGAIIDGGEVTIAGIATHTETLTLDSAPLLIEQNGNFSKTLTLPKGSVILLLTAADRFKRTTSVRRSVFVQ